MTKDYKQSSGGSSRHALWPGIVIGVVIGLAVAIAVVLFVRRTPDSFVDRGAGKTSESDARAVVQEPIPPAASTGPATPDTGKPRFDFYNILPGNEEPAPIKDVKPVPQDPEVAVKQQQLYLQLGSFQSEAEADNLKAKLALMGVEARIETADVPEKGLFHRVRVGPYASMQELNRVREQLNQNGVQSSVFKVDQP